jgi:hypothetical protein
MRNDYYKRFEAKLNQEQTEVLCLQDEVMDITTKPMILFVGYPIFLDIYILEVGKNQAIFS